MTQNRRSQLRANTLHLFEKILYGFLISASIGTGAAASPATDSLRYSLMNTDCAYLVNDHAFDLWVLDKRFPLPSGFDFFGYELDGVAFRKQFELEPIEYLKEHPGSTVEDAVRKNADQRASVYYYQVEEKEALDDPEFHGFELLEWRGLTLLYRISVGGRQIETTVHHVIVRAEGQFERLSMTATNLEQITNIIACASDT